MAHYLLSVHTSDDEPAAPPSEEEMQETMRAVTALEDEMKEANAYVGRARLTDAAAATVVKSADGEAVTTDGPFAEAKEHMAGFYIVETGDIDGALRWASKTSEVTGMPIEVRAFAGLELE